MADSLVRRPADRRTGIITAVVLGVARAVGETAPLLFTIFGNNFVNANPFHGPQSSLTLFLFQKIKSSSPAEVSLAYTAALVLVIIVLVLFTITRILAESEAEAGSSRAERVVQS